MSAEEERAGELAEVLDALAELGDRLPGSPLRADDWNALVDTLGTVARLTSAGEGGQPGPVPAPPGELPPGSVSMAELAPQVQDLLRSGPFADRDWLSSRFSLDRRLTAATERLTALENRLEAMLAALHRTETDVSRHGSDLRLVDQRVAGTARLKAEVAELRTLLGTVREDIADVLKLRRQLEGVDLGALRANVTELSAFRDAWRDGQGQVLTFAGFASRLAEVGDRAITEEELEAILDARLEQVVVDTGPIRTAVTNDLRAEVIAAKQEIGRDTAASVAKALKDLRGVLDAEVARVVGTQVAALAGQLSGIAAQAADARFDVAREELLAQTGHLVGERLKQLGPLVAPEDLADLEARLGVRLEAVRAAGITRDEVGALLAQARADLERRIDDVAAGVEVNRRGQAELGATLRRERAEASVAESRRLDGLIETQARREAIERSGAVEAAAARVTAELGGRLEETARVLRAERDAAVAAAVLARTEAIRGELEARVRVVARDAVAAVEADVSDLRGQVRDLGTRLAELDKRTGGRRELPDPEPGGGR